MNDFAFFLLSFFCGIVARAVALPADLLAKKNKRLPLFICDFTLTIAGGIPFSLCLLFVVRSNVNVWFLLSFNAGIAVMTLLVAKLQTKIEALHKREKVNSVKP